MADDELEALRRLLRTLRASPPAPWERDPDPPLDLALCSTYFLLDPDHKAPFYFVTEKLPRLLYELTHRIEQRRMVYRGQVRGTINWPATIKAQNSYASDSSVYVCRQAESQYNIAENQLLCALLRGLERCLAAVPQAIWHGWGWDNGSTASAGVALWPRLDKFRYALDTALQDARLRSVRVPDKVGSWHLLRANTAPVRTYVAVAELYGRYMALQSRNWQTVQSIGERLILLPATSLPQLEVGDQTGNGLTTRHAEAWFALAAALLRAPTSAGESSYQVSSQEKLNG